MKHIEYNKLDIDPFNEDDWDEVEPQNQMEYFSWLKINYPDESKWKDIKSINCHNNNLY